MKAKDRRLSVNSAIKDAMAEFKRIGELIACMDNKVAAAAMDNMATSHLAKARSPFVCHLLCVESCILAKHQHWKCSISIAMIRRPRK